MANPTVAFPDVEALTVSYLKTALSGLGDPVSVSTKIPAVRPDRLVRVTRTGGPRRDAATDSAQVTVECWDDDGPGAASLARMVRALLWALPGQTVSGSTVYRVQEAAGPASFPDPETRSPRYQLTVVVDVRGAVL